jgi:pyruvate formate lyase activating enzyme
LIDHTPRCLQAKFALRIAGYVPSSLIDFPGRVSAVIFTPGCTLRCPYCHNAHLVRDDGDRSPHEENKQKVYALLEQRRGLLGGVTVSGGEPCLQEGLADFLRAVRKIGYAIKLDTNGTCPEALASLLKEALVDIIAMDIKAPRDRYAELCGMPESKLPWDKIEASIQSIIAAEKSRKPDDRFHHFFRTTCMEPHFDTEAILRMRELVPAGLPWRLQPYEEREDMLDPSFSARPPAPETLGEWQRLLDAR